jgi:hypothetical protein
MIRARPSAERANGSRPITGRSSATAGERESALLNEQRTQ